MKRVCAWCNKYMGEIDAGEENTDLITHTICDDCADNLDFQLGVSLQRYIDSLRIPIVLVDDQGTILQANRAARELNCTEPVPGAEWTGKVYECAHTRLPERCENTVHCSGCTIRFAATETYETGHDRRAIPALETGCTSMPTTDCDYYVTTTLVDGIVWLTITPAEGASAS